MYVNSFCKIGMSWLILSLLSDITSEQIKIQGQDKRSAYAHVRITCPKLNKENEVSFFECHVDKRKLTESNCENASITLDTLHKTSQLFFCRQDLPTGKCQYKTPPSGWCLCTSKTSGYYTYRFALNTTKVAHEGSNISCQVYCKTPVQGVTYYQEDTCLFIKVGETTETSPANENVNNPPDVSTLCPKLYKENDVNIFECHVNKNRITSSNCNNTSFNVVTPWLKLPPVLCTDDSPQGKCRLPTPAPNQCSCTIELTGFYIYKFALNTTKVNHEGSNISCQIFCQRPVPNTIYDHENTCYSIKVGKITPPVTADPSVYDIEADLTDYDRQLEQECDEIYRAAKTAKGIREEYAVWITVLVVWIQKVIVSF